MAGSDLRQFYLSVHGKSVAFLERAGGCWEASCACTALSATVTFLLAEAQVLELVSIKCRRIDAVLPQTPPALREIFISGLTPAEFDLAMTGRVRPKPAYLRLGYHFPECSPANSDSAGD